MKKRELVIVNVALVLLAVIIGVVTFNLSSNESLSAILFRSAAGNSNSQVTTVTKCSADRPLSINSTSDPNIQKLVTYQNVCDSYVTNTLMFFTVFPQSTSDAQTLSGTVANKLKAFSSQHITPIVVVEPYIGSGLMSYQDYLNGKYDPAVTAFFADLKAANVSDQMMGTWVPFPESNTPSWDNQGTEPSDFATAVNKYLGAMKADFPNAKGSVLLDAETYEPTDTQWANGDYLSLVPYLQDVDKNLVTSVGIEGFPWVSAASTSYRAITSPAEFLQPDLAIDAAQELRTRDIWFNTGSFYAKYTNSPPDKQVISALDRQAVLSGIIDEANYIRNYQENQYRVSINLFAQDKSNTTEATDWSYFQNNDMTRVLKNFLATANQDGIPVSLFDQPIQTGQ